MIPPRSVLVTWRALEAADLLCTEFDRRIEDLEGVSAAVRDTCHRLDGEGWQGAAYDAVLAQVDAAHRHYQELCERAGALRDAGARALSDLHYTALALLDYVADAEAAGCRVADDWSVTGGAVAAEWAEVISEAVTAVERTDERGRAAILAAAVEISHLATAFDLKVMLPDGPFAGVGEPPAADPDRAEPGKAPEAGDPSGSATSGPNSGATAPDRPPAGAAPSPDAETTTAEEHPTGDKPAVPPDTGAPAADERSSGGTPHAVPPGAGASADAQSSGDTPGAIPPEAGAPVEQRPTGDSAGSSSTDADAKVAGAAAAGPTADNALGTSVAGVSNPDPASVAVAEGGDPAAIGESENRTPTAAPGSAVPAAGVAVGTAQIPPVPPAPPGADTSDQQPENGVAALVFTPQPQAAAPPPPPTDITADQLVAIMPDLSPDQAQEYLPALNAAMREGDITTPPRQAAFLAQLAHESCQLRYFEELGDDDYFSQYDPGQPNAAAGNTEPGDGPRYHGRGPIQLTGRGNYRAAGEALGLDLEGNPELAAQPDIGFRVAQWYWTSRNINALADAGDFAAVTQAVNGGFNGLDAREEYYSRALEVLG